MRIGQRPSTTLLRAGLAALALALAGTGCGSSKTKTVSVSSAPPAATGTPNGTSATQSTATQAQPSATATTTTTTPSTTRTAPAPAFTESEQHAPAGAATAAATVRSLGFTPNDLSEYHSSQTLRVLVGTRTGSGDGYGQRAFFFLEGRYLGTDAKEPSAKLRVLSQSETEVTIAYPLYRHSDPLCCPGAGQAVVHFQLNDGKLTALQPIPPASSTTGLARN